MPYCDLLRYENLIWKSGKDMIAGVDEVGRGCLAGPMVVSAVILNPKHLNEDNIYSSELALYTQIRDSKELSSKKRLNLDEFIRYVSISYSIVEISHSMIDKRGLSYCTQLSFYQAIKKLNIIPAHVLTDSFEIRKFEKEYQTNVAKGDKKSISIAAASIVAKVYRDKLMIDLHEKVGEYKPYRFDLNKGYGTALHKKMITKYGLSNIHRQSFHLK